LLADSGKTEIPDTPEAIASSQTYEKEKAPALFEAAPAPQNAIDHAPLQWLQTVRVAATPKKKHKKAGEAAVAKTNYQNELAAKFEANNGPIVAAYHGSPIAMCLADISPQQTHVEQQSMQVTEYQHISGLESPDVSHNRTKEAFDQSVSSAPSENRDEFSTPAPVSERLLHSTPKSRRLQLGTRLLNDNSRSIADQPEACIGVSTERRYTNRQLARIALVAANGNCMTTSQIILWLARTFSYLRVGENNWEMNIRSVLSGFEEFQGRKIPEAHGNKKLYGFSSPGLRVQFEAEYSEFLASSKPHTTPVQLESGTYGGRKPQDDQPPATKRAVKSALNLPKSMTEHRSKTNMVSSRHLPITQADQATKDTSFNPFERSVPRPPFKLLNSNHSFRQETALQAATPYTYQSTFDTMTKIEKAQWIEQIKARPSRKAYFGSGHRLAHKRRHDLEDIHDERDGAWRQPMKAVEDKSLEVDQSISIDEDKGSRTLRAVFNLPDNMVPVNDGQTELAFKDGTKGKRSRTIYRVGKMFGGELTVRLS
jgi:hypothetical protein